MRFKQIELHNRLVDLFIDVPIEALEPSRRPDPRAYRALQIAARMIDSGIEDGRRNSTDQKHSPYRVPHYDRSARSVGAAAFFLSRVSHLDVPNAVIEGAPGQGKSTVLQYICQVYRARILHDEELLSLLPGRHRVGPLRFPFKVDLRDYATWLRGRNPFSTTSENRPEGWKKSLEAFLAAQIRHHSGGTEFSVDDFLSIAHTLSGVIAFDGLDEVADIQNRKDVVDEILRAVNRLRENFAELQVIVTSRPAAFANSPGFPEEKFPHFQLGAVTPGQIREYADKWVEARKLGKIEAAEVKSLLAQKMAEPHLRDLARNPMQLAILLSLVYTRGASLPDKRTALYDSYVNLFFDREAEKSEVVRMHREVLISIHRYLAWVLHAEAETGGGQGSIAEDRLTADLKRYLEGEGHDPNLAGEIFKGMVERVVALVSRVEGTYEFEVQPLREYFAARHLYETAPYSPAGAERYGTKPDRFDAIARNNYWLNVTRFYAGCYSKGELSSLMDGLRDLVEAPGVGETGYPRWLAMVLLADYVFAQHPRSVARVISLISEGPGLHLLLAASDALWRSQDFVLPEPCGRQQFVNYCIRVLSSKPQMDIAERLAALVGRNAPEEVVDLWKAGIQGAAAEDELRWWQYGLPLGILNLLPPDQIRSYLYPLKAEKLGLLVKAGRSDVIAMDPSARSLAASLIVDLDIDLGDIWMWRVSRSGPALAQLRVAVWPWRYAIALFRDEPVPIGEMWDNHGMIVSADEVEPVSEVSGLQTVDSFLATVASLGETSALEWTTSTEHWERLVEGIRLRWGSRWSAVCIANLAAGIRSRKERFPEAGDLFEEEIPLTRRCRYARLRAGEALWWKARLQEASTEEEMLLAATSLASWGSEKCLLKNLGELSFLEDLDSRLWLKLFRAVRLIAVIQKARSGRSPLSIVPEDLRSTSGPRILALLGQRCTRASKRNMFSLVQSGYAGQDYAVWSFCQEEAIKGLFAGDGNMHSILSTIERSYLYGGVAPEQDLPHQFQGKMRISIDAARRIANNPDHFPLALVTLAEAKLRRRSAESIVPVREISERERWFQQA